ncbi:MAG: Gfo/Idh/MocA family oxidoreductase [Bacteroidetes bacterium]|nr:Gfo/Idh/MocA family oxidoreductase [Bacteroidota bacterium]
MLNIGVLGAGHLGKIHLRLIKEIPDYELIGFYDPNEENAKKAEVEFGIKRFNDIDELIDAAEVVDIVTPTLSHYDCAVNAIRKSKHVFIEKPITNSLEEAKHLLELSEEASVKAQVGHVERFNPAFLSLGDKELHPMFIETHRLAQFNPRGTDVPVVLDLMIHDIDIILSLVKSNVKKISANGVSIISDSSDIANARIEFDNGCVANITASRISMKNMRKMRIFQRDAYISLDFLEKTSEIFTLSEDSGMYEIDTGTSKKYISFDKPKVKESNAIKMELELFNKCIVEDTEPIVTVSDGYNALYVAYQILDRIEKTSVV